MLNQHTIDAREFFERASRICLTIGGISCTITSRGSDFINQLRERYFGFVNLGPSSWEAILQLRPLEDFSFDDVGRPGSAPVQPLNSGNNYIIRQTARPFMALVNTLTKKALVKMRQSQTCFHEFLRVLYALVLTENNGIMVRASAVKSHGSANILIDGEPLKRREPESNDELVAIVPHHTGFRIYNTPFSGEAITCRGNGRAELQALYSLQSGSRNRLLSQNKMQAVISLYRNVPYFTDNYLLLSRIFNTCCDIVEAVPTYQLQFQTDVLKNS